MALIKCPECEKEVSDTIENCIHCGYKIKKNTLIDKDDNKDKKSKKTLKQKWKNMNKIDKFLSYLTIVFISFTLLVSLPFIFDRSSSEINEDDLVGLKYENLSDSDNKYIWHWEFKEANVLYWYSTNCGIGGSPEKECNGDSESYEIDEDGILIITNGNSSDKWKISEDLSTITEIGSEIVMSKVN